MYDRAGRPTITNPPPGRGARARAPVVRIARLRLALAAGDHGSRAIVASRRTPRAHGGGRGAVSPPRRLRANSSPSLASRNRSISGQSLTRVPSRRAPLPPQRTRSPSRLPPPRTPPRLSSSPSSKPRTPKRCARPRNRRPLLAHTRQEASHSVAVLNCDTTVSRKFDFANEVRERRVASPPSLTFPLLLDAPLALLQEDTPGLPRAESARLSSSQPRTRDGVGGGGGVARAAEGEGARARRRWVRDARAW